MASVSGAAVLAFMEQLLQLQLRHKMITLHKLANIDATHMTVFM